MAERGSTQPPEGDARYFGGPLQLVRIDDEGRLHLQDDAVSILRQIQGRLAVVSIAGLYRTGKSFLLNRVLGVQDGFEVGPSVNPCTRGLWLWGQPVRLAPDYHCVLIDAEGLGSARRTASCDMEIMSLCVLLSSCFIYNSVGAIDEQAIDDLHLVLQLAKHIHVKSGRVGESSELALYLPRFLWVLRDFHLKLVNEQGADISEREYLENALKPVPGSGAKNEVRNTLRDLFRERDCSTIVRPVADEADLQKVQHLPYESLRPDFRTQVEAFVKKVYGSLKPKKIEGTYVTGALLAGLASEYCQAINCGAVPSICSSWASVVQQQLRLSLRDAVQLYRQRMNDEVMKRLPMEEEALRGVHKAAKAAAMKAFTALSLAGDPAHGGCQAELVVRMRQLHDHALAENRAASLRECERLAQELYDSHIGSRLGAQSSHTSCGRLLRAWAEVRQSYMQQAKGPAKSEVLLTWISNRQAKDIRVAWDAFRGSMEEQQAALQRRAAEAEGDMKNAGGQDVSKQTDGVEQGRRRWITDKIKLEVQLRDMRREKEDTSKHEKLQRAQLEDAVRTSREQVKALQERLRESEAKRKSIKTEMSSAVTAELQSLQRAVSSATSEVQNSDMCERELKMKARHERQLLGLEREFLRRLDAARRECEGLLEGLRADNDSKVEAMQKCQDELAVRNGDLQTQLERALADVELLRQQKVHSDREHALQLDFVKNAERQAQLVTAFLERESEPDPSSTTTLGDALRETAQLGTMGKQDSFLARRGSAPPSFGAPECGGRSPPAQRWRAFEGGA